MRSKTKSSRAHSASVDSNLKTSLITPIMQRKKSLLDQVKKRKKMKRYLLSVKPNITGADTVLAMAGVATAGVATVAAGEILTAGGEMLTTHGDEFSN